MGSTDWKQKYMDLKSRYMADVDMAFRLGHQQGGQEAQMQAMVEQQQAEADAAMQEQQGMGGEEGMEGQEPGQPEEQAPDSAHPGGSEFDQHVSQLESMVQKGEVDMVSLAKSIGDLRSLAKKVTFEREMKKSAMAIPAIAKALHKPKFKLSQAANHNLTTVAKAAVTSQAKIVDDVLKSWNEEEERAKKNIVNHLNIEGLIKKD